MGTRLSGAVPEDQAAGKRRGPPARRKAGWGRTGAPGRSQTGRGKKGGL